MVFSWIKRQRRAKLLAEPFPYEWLEILKRNVRYYPLLRSDEQARLRDDLRVLIAEKTWEGCGGQEINDEIKVTIAAQACLLLVGLDHDYFDRVLSILVYPTAYSVPTRHGTLIGGPISISGERYRLGEAWYRGPVVLSWADVLRDSQHPGRGRNLVWHEFAHQLDMLDREVDGTPPLANREQYRRWTEVMTAAFEQLREAIKAGQPTLLDPYAATNEGEFFAVATECFFDQPVELSERHPELYALLRDYFHQDPVQRLRRRNVGRAPD